MSQSWVRGPVCGVDNCTSRLYKSADGFKICQYGHVMEGNIEINDDQDDNFVQTKRLNINLTGLGGDFLNSQTSRGNILNRNNKNKKLYGVAAKELYLQCAQILLQKQLKIVIKLFLEKVDFDIISEIEPLVKLYWIRTLKSYLIPESNAKTIGGDEAKVKPTEGEVAAVDSIRREPAQAMPELNLNDSNASLPTTIDLICIIYLSLLQMRLPIYAHDILNSIKQNDVPYMKCLHLIPKALLDRLPPYYMGLIEPRKLPLENELYENIQIIGKRIRYQKAELSANYFYPLGFKLFSKVLLFPNAPDLFMIWTMLSERIVGENAENLHFAIVEKDLKNLAIPKRLWKTKGIPKRNIVGLPELRMAVLIIVTVKFYFMFNPTKMVGKVLDAKIWLQNISQYELDHEFPISQTNDSEEDILSWSDTKINRYCQWVYENLIPKKNKTFNMGSEEHEAANLEELSMMDKRLFQIFNIDQQEYKSSGKRKLDIEKAPGFKENGLNEAEVFAGYGGDQLNANTNAASDMIAVENYLIEKLSNEFGVTRDIIEGCNTWVEGCLKRSLG